MDMIFLQKIIDWRVNLINTDKSGFSNNIGSINNKSSVSIVPPVAPLQNDLWLDSTTNLQYRWNGTMWVPLGGNVILWTAGENLYQGECVYIYQSTGALLKNPTGGYNMIGFVFADALSGNDIYIVLSGLAYVLPKSTLSLTQGYVLFVASGAGNDGRVDNQSSISGLNYALCLGHVMENSSSAGALTLAVIQPN